MELNQSQSYPFAISVSFLSPNWNLNKYLFYNNNYLFEKYIFTGSLIIFQTSENLFYW